MSAKETEVAILAGGCFWGVEEILRAVPGVLDTDVGYTGGWLEHPVYDDTHESASGHAEAVRIVFDPTVLSFESLLENWFFRLHDPTTLNRQGNDVGTQYRSAIYYHSEAQKKVAEASKVAAQADFKSPIVTEITQAVKFYPAENYHQNYYKENKSKNSYCRFVIEPKLRKLKLDH